MSDKSKPHNDTDMFLELDRCGPYLVSQHHEDGMAIAELTPEEFEKMEENGKSNFKDLYVGGGFTAANIGTICSAATVGMPLWAYWSAYSLSLGATTFASFRAPVQHVSRRRAKRNIVHSISKDPSRYMVFPYKEIELRLPQEVLGESVEFQSEIGLTTQTAEELAQSVKNDLLGLNIKIPKKGCNRPLEATVSPGNLLSTAMRQFPREEKGEFLMASMEPIRQLHTSLQNLPREGFNTDGLPEGVRQLHESMSSNVFLGALGVYGTLRAQVGVNVSRTIADLYSQHAKGYLRDEALLADVVKFGSPTTDQLTWQQIALTKMYVG